MRQQLFNVLLFCFVLFSIPVRAQDNSGVRLSMSFDHKTLPWVFLKLEQNSSYKFLFTYEDVAKYKVTASFRNAQFFDIVDKVLQNTPLEYRVNGKFIQVTLRDGKHRGSSDRKMRTYGGYIFDDHNEPVIGAQVRVEGTDIITVTDLNGAYSFDYYLPGNNKIRVSYVGMKTVEIPLRQNMRINLKPDTHQLGDIVVTGIFRKARESYTGAISTITREKLDQVRGVNLLQTLRNADASINFGIDNLNGSNPNTIPDLNIRGRSSLPMSVKEFNETTKDNPNTPLIIMDGFEISLQKLMDYNDEEIESINILKDAAATAIYGSRGANGVIVVVSRKPEPGKLKISLETELQLEVPDLSSYHLLNASEKLELEKKAGLYDHDFSMLDGQELLYKEAYNKRLREVLMGVNTDWMAKPLRTGVGQRYNLRLEGGSKEFQWATDLQYNDIQGAMKGSDRRTFTGAITLMYQLKSLTFRNYTSLDYNHSHESPYGSFDDYVNQQPYNSPYDAQGNLRKYLEPFFDWGEEPENPLYNASLGSFNKSNYQTVTNNFSVDWDLFPFLTLRGQLGISRTDNESNIFKSPEDTYFSDYSTGSAYQSGDGFLRRGLYNYSDGKTQNVNADVTLSFNKVFKEVHSLYAGLNWSMQESSYDDFSIALEGFSNDKLANIANARQYAQDQIPTGSNTRTRQFGVTGNVNYTYNSRYYIDLSYRMDGNSTYGSDKKYAPFWSVGVGWNVHQEPFLKGNRIINMLRLKGSVGETGAASGASETDAYTYYKYATDNRYMSWTGALLGGFGNTDLSWQSTRSWNIGTEFGLFDNRIKGTLDIYVKNTNNLLSSMDLPLSMGFDSYTANVGKVRNNGMEASLSAYIIRDRVHQFNWLVSGQIVYDKNKITHLSQAIKDQTTAYMMQDADNESASGIQKLFEEGKPENAIYAVRSLGIDPSTGKEIFLDKNGNITDVWKASDKVYCGSADPLYRGNFDTMLQWKDLSLNFSFGYYWGGKVYNSTLRDRVEVTYDDIVEHNVDRRVLNSRWFQPGDITFFKGLSYNQTKATSRYVMDNKVLTLQSASLQYKLHSSWLMNHFSLQTVIFGLNVNDLFYWSTVRMERGTSYPYARNVQASVKLLF